jgi:hypothetical protein
MNIQASTTHIPLSTTSILKSAGEKEVNEKAGIEADPNLQKLKATDAHVRSHEAAHLAAGGGVVTGGASFSYEKGSDERMYAVGGEVPIDTSEASTPEATVQKARQIAAAAMAPADPSPQDYRVAASALIMEMQAKIEVMQEAQNKLKASDAYQTEEDSYEEDETQLHDKMADIA